MIINLLLPQVMPQQGNKSLIALNPARFFFNVIIPIKAGGLNLMFSLGARED